MVLTEDSATDEPETTLSVEDLSRFIPVAWAPPWVRWMDLQGRRLDLPFFGDVVREAEGSDPPPETIWTGPEALELLAQFPASLMPAGFIFHMGRCGSTALACSLAAIAEFHVVSEAGLINSILLASLDGTPVAQQRLLIRGAIQALAAPYARHRTRYFVKLSSWNTLRISSILEMFPGVPWIFVHRDPLEVLVSLERKPPGWAAPEHRCAMWELLGASAAPPECQDEFLAAMLAGVCESAVRAFNHSALMVNHCEISPAALGYVAAHFQSGPTDEMLLRFAKSLEAYSKAPSSGTAWIDDSLTKRAESTQRQRDLVDRVVRPVHSLLSAISAP